MFKSRNSMEMFWAAVVAIGFSFAFAGPRLANAAMITIDSGEFISAASGPNGGNQNSMPVSFGSSYTDSLGNLLFDIPELTAEYSATNIGDTAVFRVDTTHALSAESVPGNTGSNAAVIFTLLEPVTYTFTGELSADFPDQGRIFLSAEIQDWISADLLYGPERNDLTGTGTQTLSLDDADRSGLLNPGTYRFRWGINVSADDLTSGPAFGEGSVQLTLQS